MTHSVAPSISQPPKLPRFTDRLRWFLTIPLWTAMEDEFDITFIKYKVFKGDYYVLSKETFIKDL